MNKEGKFYKTFLKKLFRSDEGPTLETSAFKLLAVANLRHQLSWYQIYFQR